MSAAEVEATVRRFLDAIDRADLDALTPLWADAPSMFFPLPDRLTRGRQAILSTFESMFQEFRRRRPSPPYMGFKLYDVNVHLCDAAALCTFSYTIGKHTARRSIFLIRAGAVWRIQHVHGSNAKRSVDE
jgi:ketosteroid isomerase-like protein